MDQENFLKEGKGFYKLNEESIASVHEDLAANLGIACHLYQYEVERKATGIQEVKTVQLLNSPLEEHESVPDTQEEPKSTTHTQTDVDSAHVPTSVLTKEPTSQLEPMPVPTTKSTPQPDPTQEPTTEPTPAKMLDPEPTLQDTPVHPTSADTTQTKETETVASELPQLVETPTLDPTPTELSILHIFDDA